MKYMKQTLLMLAIAASLSTISCRTNNFTGSAIEGFSNDVILKWNEVAYEAFGGTAYQHSLMASRINAMVHVAMHDALNAIYPKYETYAFKGKDPDANAVAAAAKAAHTVLVHEIPARKNYIDSVLEQTLSDVPNGDAKTSGIRLGEDVAEAVLANRINDGASGNPLAAVAESKVPGVYQPVPPFDFYFAPHWENVTLFGLQRKDQFRCLPPPSLDSKSYTEAFNEVKELGKLNSALRTSDQSTYARFWYEFSEAGWNRVARVVAVSKKLDLMETARLFALVDMAMADAYIAGWDSKLHYNLWRPYTAIRNANSDGNNQAVEDLLWEPAAITPPIQDYPSTHSALGNASATVLANLVGDMTPFTLTSPTAIPSGSARTFTSFSQAAKENADSRVMAGIHFRFACEAGLELGSKVGHWITNNSLKPLN